MMNAPAKSRRAPLGRGLSALIPSPPSATKTVVEAGTLLRLPIENIKPSDEQPRQSFDDAAIAELAQSIKEHGVIQPVIVRRLKDRSYTLVAGERRWRAAQKAGLHELPAVLHDAKADDALLLALVENIQREDLNPIDEAEAYQRLSTELSLSQEQIAKQVGKERATVANSMRLLKLPKPVRDQVSAGDLGMGHARALLAVDDEKALARLAREVVRKKLSVRDVERRVKLFKMGKTGTQAQKSGSPKPESAANRDVSDKLMRSLGTKVALREKTKSSGTIEISYSSLDELDRLISLLC